MKILKVSILIGICIGLVGCSSRGMMTAGHNGKKYWNPGNCSQYRYYNNDPDAIHCLSDGQETGVVLRPMSQQDVNNQYREQEQTQQAIRDFNNQLNQMNRNMNSGYSGGNTVRCTKFGSMGFNQQIYTFNGSVCPIGYSPAY